MLLLFRSYHGDGLFDFVDLALHIVPYIVISVQRKYILFYFMVRVSWNQLNFQSYSSSLAKRAGRVSGLKFPTPPGVPRTMRGEVHDVLETFSA